MLVIHDGIIGGILRHQPPRHPRCRTPYVARPTASRSSSGTVTVAASNRGEDAAKAACGLLPAAQGACGGGAPGPMPPPPAASVR